ncbi:MAG: hypothetical protein GY928_27965 [Colwellia sp.]|nr:hypothetical protein [Colwellia sp.]
MLNRVFIYEGESLLPHHTTLDTLLKTQEPISSELTKESNYFDRPIFVSHLADKSLKELGAERMIRKTSEKQARWLIAAGVRSWRQYFERGDEHCGLFLGLGTVDCDEEDTPEIIDDPTPENLSDAMLETRRPLVCLALLNSSATSHLAQLTCITGETISFSPLLDAGLNAFLEAFYAIQEQRVQHALCGGGSQKITPWHFLSYESLWQGNDNLWFSDAAAFQILSADSQLDGKKPDGEVLLSKRGRLSNKSSSLEHIIETVLETCKKQNINLNKVLVAGASNAQYQMLNNVLPKTLLETLIALDDLVGNTMAAAPALCCNLATTYLRTVETGAALVITLGENKQFGCIVIGAYYD